MTQTSYSAAQNMFYANAIRRQYEDGAGWPADCVEVSDEIFTKFALALPPEGKVRIAGADGLPAWGDAPE